MSVGSEIPTITDVNLTLTTDCTHKMFIVINTCFMKHEILGEILFVLAFEPLSCHLTYAYDEARFPRPTDTSHEKSWGVYRVLDPLFQEWDKKVTSLLSFC
jgi:hypothetical protein